MKCEKKKNRNVVHKTFRTEIRSLSGVTTSRSKYCRSKEEGTPCINAAEKTEVYVAKYLGPLVADGVSKDAEKIFLCSLWQIILAISEVNINGKLKKMRDTRNSDSLQFSCKQEKSNE